MTETFLCFYNARLVDATTDSPGMLLVEGNRIKTITLGEFSLQEATDVAKNLLPAAEIDYIDCQGKLLQPAFTESAQSLIAGTSVDNSAASTNPASDPNLWNSGTNPYACDNTMDKIFLLSEEEATTGVHLKEKDLTAEDYGFDEYSGSGKGNTRIRVTTDYAKATGAEQSSTPGSGGYWWLRSPYYSVKDFARVIDLDGDADDRLGDSLTLVGVVPALSISL